MSTLYRPLTNQPNDNDENYVAVDSPHASQLTQSDVSMLMLDELRDLKELSRKLAEEPPLKSQYIWTFILQLFALIAGSLFGIFAILAWKVSKDGNAVAILNNNAADVYNSQAYAVAVSANTLAEQVYAAATSANSIAAQAYDAATSANVLAVEASFWASMGAMYAATGLNWASAAFADIRESNKMALFEHCRSMASTGDLTGSDIELCAEVASTFSQSLSVYATVLFQIGSPSAYDAYIPYDGYIFFTPTTITATGTSMMTLTDTSVESTVEVSQISNSQISGSAASITSTASINTSTDDQLTRSSPSATSTVTSPSSDSSSSSHESIIVGAVVGGILAFIFLVAAAIFPYMTYRQRLRRSQELSKIFDKRARKF